MNLVPTRRSSHRGLLRTLLLEHGTIFCRFRHSFCAISSEDYKVSRLYDITQSPFEYGSLMDPARPRLSWHARLNTATLEKQSTQTRIPFSSNQSATRRFVPYVQELLNGFWSMDQDPIWILIDDLVATGEPQSSRDAFPEFQQWEHVVMASNFSEATLTLVSQGYLRYQSPLEERDELVEDDEVADEDGHRSPNSTPALVPTWLVAFMLATMPHTRVDAYEGLTFCLSQLDATPKHLRAPLLLLSMCSLATHKIAVQVPILLGAFHDMFSNTDPDLVAKPDRWRFFGSRESIIYQHNILLTLLSLFPHVPGIARSTIGLLQHMEASGVLLDVDTANKLIGCRFASNGLVATIRDVLERQGMHDAQQKSNELSFALLRFYSKRSNQSMAAEYAEASLRKRPSQFAQAYLRSFRNAAESVAYLRSIEERKQREVTWNSQSIGSACSLHRSFSDQNQTISPSPTAEFRGVTKRHVYSSLLHSVSISKTLSAETFRDLFTTIREAHGDDRELETIAISGMLKRKAWDQAKDLWDQWQTTNRSIRSILREMRSFLERRDRNFGDAGNVRRTLGWSKLTEQVTTRRMNMLSVDASALSVIVRALAGPKPESLASSFATMDDYALKLQNSESRPVDMNYSGLPKADAVTDTGPVVEQVQLTSRVINCFMVRAMYFRRPDIVFRLWDGMTSYYGVDSSITTLDILIRSARLAASMETALTKFTPKWMMLSSGFFKKPVHPNFSAEIMWMLSPSYSPTPRWDGVPAWRMVRRLFREEIIFANFPRLRNVSIPAQAVRGDDATGKVEAFKELTTAGGLWGTQARKMGDYPHLMPSARIFREYIVMLGRVHRSSEIPEVLAWMKALNLLPSRRCLSLSLALWSQVGLDSLADDVWGVAMPGHHSRTGLKPSSLGHQRHGGEHDKLLVWLETWVGENNVPEESEVLDAFRYLQELEEREEFLY
jgi:hypothetical protein